ncbi:MAG: hypothetical protein AAF434_18730 [Pseudomonadota bacterium]
MRVLFSARDPAAAQVAGNLYAAAQRDQRFEPYLVAASPAFGILKSQGFQILELQVSSTDSHDLIEQRVTSLIDGVAPLAIVAGSSGPDAGVDEYLVKYGSKCRTYVVQDFWGDVNLAAGEQADCYLVCDQFAADLTNKRVDAETLVVGSVKHAHFAALNVDALRSKSRALLSVHGDDFVIGYFGAPLADCPGYWRSVEALAHALSAVDAKIVYRPHPKESTEARERTADILGLAQSSVDNASEPVETLLAGCDLVVSCYSSCGIDAELMNSQESNPSRVSMFLLFDQEILEHYQAITRLPDVPISMQNRSVSVHSEKSLGNFIREFADRPTRVKFLENAKSNQSVGVLPTAAESPKRVLDKVWSDINSARQKSLAQSK